MSLEIDASQALAGLKKLDAQMQGAAITKCLHAAAQYAEGKVKEQGRSSFVTRTGTLINSIQSTAEGKEAVVYVGADYGVYLEMGTSRGIAPRHYVQRGVQNNLQGINKAAVETLKGILGL